jgi:hypothetical protein
MPIDPSKTRGTAVGSGNRPASSTFRHDVGCISDRAPCARPSVGHGGSLNGMLPCTIQAATRARAVVGAKPRPLAASQVLASDNKASLLTFVFGAGVRRAKYRYWNALQSWSYSFRLFAASAGYFAAIKRCKLRTGAGSLLGANLFVQRRSHPATLPAARQRSSLNSIRSQRTMELFPR